jgi:hypothetical protein
MLLPPLEQETGWLPPGRYHSDLDELHARFVAAEVYAVASRREELWSQWELHRSLMEAFAGGIERLWLAGSFVTSKLEPSDVDMVYLLPAKEYDQLQAEDLGHLDELTDPQWCRKQGMCIDAFLLRVPGETEFWRLTPESLVDADRSSFLQLGIYDEIWQRTRNGTRGSTRRAADRRGYVEVQL